MAAVNSSKLCCSESRLNVMFRWNRMIFKLHFMFTFLLLFVSLCFSDDDHEMEEFLKREFSLSKPYQGVGSLGSSHWELMGDAMVTTDQVRLTPDMQSRQGAVWSRIPCQLKDWEMQVHFKVHGQGKKNLNGDGLAIWYTKERMQKGPVFGNMDNFTGLGVFVDTYPNEEKHIERIFPYVITMVGNGTISYDHERDGRHTELGGCNAMVRNLKHDTFLFIRYVRRRLTVMIDIDGQHEWRDCLDIPGVRLPLGYYFGASAITGDLSDNHDIISLKLYQLTVLRSKKEEEEEEQDVITIPSVDNMELLRLYQSEEGMSGLAIFFTVLFSMLGCIFLIVIGIVVYSQWNERRRKRFY
ncbi:lectin, mannose-binding 2-like a isoform X2 [Girardinichthys multiradiatus]|uniref:lectin, mannose-binding 2-like a isoform X2 n=1 Tax=Girardinichthys multiradiatus TaxID=208333 RepID=UPI001FAB54F8|nr:lectin, mannose-binding 2-like a isoform X2 [Girardinichthys multiradiatus]